MRSRAAVAEIRHRTYGAKAMLERWGGGHPQQIPSRRFPIQDGMKRIQPLETVRRTRGTKATKVIRGQHRTRRRLNATLAERRKLQELSGE